MSVLTRYRYAHPSALVVLACTLVNAPFAYAADKSEPVDYAQQIRPILASNCFACHGADPGSREAELRLDTPEGAVAKLESGEQAIVPGKRSEGEFYKRITSKDPDEVMPPADSGHTLKPAEIELLGRWIDQGAKYSKHWAFIAPKKHAVPAVKDSTKVRNGIDAFVIAKLAEKNSQLAEEADRHTLARRASLDLIGIPPTPAEVDAFVNDKSPDAYEKFVDRLLASPRYGEHWARLWLDLARYADTQGYEKDNHRDIWAYRDWVIDALNRDLTYDQFTIEQLAGDLLPNASPNQILATAFHRNTMTNTEGGTDDEEFRTLAVKDRIETTIQVWMGLTMQCSNCHTHKYDPISQEEYYQFLAFFNQTEDADRANDVPRANLPTPGQQQRINEIESRLKALDAKRGVLTAEMKPGFEKWIASTKPSVVWKTPVPSSMKSKGGASMRRLEDGSILVGGKAPLQDTYAIELPVGLAQISGLRIELIPDKSLPVGGVGRAKGEGNFVLSRLKVEVVRADGSTTPLPLDGAIASHSQPHYPVTDAIGKKNIAAHGWAINPQAQRKNHGIFGTSKPVAAGAGSKVVVTIDQQFKNPRAPFTLGRFRLSLTDAQRPLEANSLPAPVATSLATQAAKRTAEQSAVLAKYYAAHVSPANAAINREYEQLKKARAAIKPPSTPVMRELANNRRRKTHINIRGSFLDKGKEVSPAVPAAFHPMAETTPKSRLGVAQWLVDRKNPLTARVHANRIWARLFGRGIVETEEDFGTQGMLPTHPKLLDWLAIEWMEGHGWSQKKLLKQIVMSATYRQSSVFEKSKLLADPRNRLFSRGPRFRLPAEVVRDQALAAAGLLSSKMYGPSVMPPQPEGVWKAVYNSSKWRTSTGEDRYRRGLYTYIRRTSPYPAMITFDAGSREVCMLRRVRTNTPLQALVTLNDPVYVEAAAALGRQMLMKEKSAAGQGAGHGFRAMLARQAEPRELARLNKMHKDALEHFRKNPTAATELLKSANAKLTDGIDPIDWAAWTTVANVLMNLDETLMKG